MKVFRKLFIFLSLIFTLFFSNSLFLSPVLAATNTEIQQLAGNKNEETKNYSLDIKFFQNIGQTLYTITWPLVIISSKFMDNQVVYGEFVGMDTMLWKIWNVMRTFTNYIIGFILIASIFSLFLGGKFEKLNPFKVLPQLALSAILINASWFLVGACIDISNILTYSVGALPLQIAKEKVDTFKEKQVPQFAIKFQSENSNILIGVKDKSGFYPYCELTALTGSVGYKILPKNVTKYKNCVYEYDGNFYKIDKSGIEVKENSDLRKLLESKGKIETKKVSEVYSNEGISGTFATLFSSLLNLGRTVAYSSGTTTALMTDLVFKLLFLFVLIIPLFTLAIILIVRVVIIWFFIVASPLIFLFSTVSSLKGVLGEKGTLSSFCCMIFMPVIVVFALSISIIFISSLNFKNIEKDFGIGLSGDNVKIKIADGHEILMRYQETGKDSAGTDLFAAFSNTVVWLIKLVFSVGFLWVVVFSALKSCKITSGIASSIQVFAQSMAKAAPIVPVAGGQSISSLSKGIGMVEQIPQQKQSEQYNKKLNPIFEELNRNITGQEQKVIERASSTISTNGSGIKPLSTSVSSNLGNYGNETISSLLGKDGDKKLESLANSLGFSKTQLKKALESVSDRKATLSSVFNSKIKTELEDIIKSDIKGFIKKNVLDNKITLFQLTSEAKAVIGKLLGTDIDLNKRRELAEKLFKLGFSEKEISLLLASNLSGGVISSEKEKKDLEEIIKEAKKTSGKK